ncbi:hypothetical protein PFDG_00516 [Plasmodium falciparum Dd2]|uniref:Uncharacterized protein n=1 Tax=Plasmodium falciparum (isolate Dd2) TaxID=57267 RepID=A0A0L7LWY6_PLAF4|nr:hypothetical protein PFDG_00516 [Plasmodium falciparum Dd2]
MCLYKTTMKIFYIKSILYIHLFYFLMLHIIISFKILKYQINDFYFFTYFSLFKVKHRNIYIYIIFFLI